jgi:hypothetical protein
VRISDVNNIENSMEYFAIPSGIYPDPSWLVEITYSWSEIWSQWTVWDSVITNLWRLNKKPVDPLYWTEYTFSRLNTKKEIELWAVLEWWGSTYNNIVWETYAADNLRSYVNWSYNWAVAKVSTGSTTYILAIPTIIATDTSDTEVMNIITKQELAFNSYSNIPWSYAWVDWYTSTWWFDYNSTNTWVIIVYEWDVSELENWANLKTLADNLILAYSWTTLEWEWIYKSLVSMNTSDMSQVSTLAWNIVNNSLW